MRVLYIHPFSVFGGATKSLSELVSAIPNDDFYGVALSPRGVAADSLKKAGMDVIEVRGIPQWDDTRFGYYRGLRWIIIFRELSYIPSIIWGLFRARSYGPFNLIHCNEITAIFVGILAKYWLNAPLLIHVRSLQRGIKGGKVSTWLTNLLRKKSDVVVAIDEAVRRSLPEDLSVFIVHNGMQIPKESCSKDKSTVELFSVGIIGVLNRSKGVYEFVEAARILKDRSVPVRMVIVGDNIRHLSGLYGWLLKKLDFAQDVRSDLEDYVNRYNLSSIVEFKGFVEDIGTIYSQLDVLCFPSHLDAPGRPVFEAALYGLPSIVAMSDPTSDVIVSGQTGICVERPEPQAIAQAIQNLVANSILVEQMGEKAKQHTIERFNSQNSAIKILNIYHEMDKYNNF